MKSGTKKCHEQEWSKTWVPWILTFTWAERASKEGSIRLTARLLNLNPHLQNFGATGVPALRNRGTLCLAIVTTAHNEAIEEESSACVPDVRRTELPLGKRRKAEPSSEDRGGCEGLTQHAYNCKVLQHDIKV